MEYTHIINADVSLGVSLSKLELHPSILSTI